MKEVASRAKEVAAKATGLRPDQVEAAVEEYRHAARALHDEPQWVALMHISMRDGGGIHQYRDPEGTTEILLQVEYGPKGDQDRGYILFGHPYETYGEAREIELLHAARPKPRAV